MKWLEDEPLKPSKSLKAGTVFEVHDRLLEERDTHFRCSSLLVFDGGLLVWLAGERQFWSTNPFGGSLLSGPRKHDQGQQA